MQQPGKPVAPLTTTKVGRDSGLDLHSKILKALIERLGLLSDELVKFGYSK
ncbi:hypothetical protein ACIAD1468 [Acinetobacter baylyi ADP1]|uniref:Uncharacterized protein n=1 Tax=Acinetobacter baylyi (strain ATCC 33305 / BD413 / ADP1) TaxID=62977 RepID=Q6FC81_ACIAD|nr:hypothetical protein ACIAD1468 [Acinetobacter baylyi ADP1]